MSLKDMTDAQLESRLSLLEGLAAKTRNTNDLRQLNATYQRIFDELVSRDMAGPAVSRYLEAAKKP